MADGGADAPWTAALVLVVLGSVLSLPWLLLHATHAHAALFHLTPAETPETAASDLRLLQLAFPLYGAGMLARCLAAMRFVREPKLRWGAVAMMLCDALAYCMIRRWIPMPVLGPSHAVSTMIGVMHAFRVVADTLLVGAVILMGLILARAHEAPRWRVAMGAAAAAMMFIHLLTTLGGDGFMAPGFVTMGDFELLWLRLLWFSGQLALHALIVALAVHWGWSRRRGLGRS